MDVVITSPNLAKPNGVAWVRFQLAAICNDAFYGFARHGEGNVWIRIWRYDTSNCDLS